jgi:DNA-directed RNA polymerase subunit RPC12/RpoP
MPERYCRLCRTGDADTGRDGICADCRDTLGIVSLPPPRRPAVPCARCGGRRFVRVVPREYTSTAGEHGDERAAPMMVTASPASYSRGRMLPGGKARVPDIRQGHGILETYICAGCGFVEWYCQDPESIPIGPEYMSDVVEYADAGDSPYR